MIRYSSGRPDSRSVIGCLSNSETSAQRSLMSRAEIVCGGSGAPPRRQRHRPALRAGHAKRRGDARLVDDLHQEHARAGLDQCRRRCPLGHFHAALGIDVDVHERVPIEDRRRRLHAGVVVGLRERGGQRLAIGRRPVAARGTRAPSRPGAPAPQTAAAAPRRRGAVRGAWASARRPRHAAARIRSVTRRANPGHALHPG